MYTIINKTSKTILIQGKEVMPNQETIILNNIYDEKCIKLKELEASCEIKSSYGEHSSNCYGNITCNPERGKDGTVFTICEK